MPKGQKRLLIIAASVMTLGVLVGVAVAASTPGAWVVHITSPSGDTLDTTITVPTTTSTTTTTVPPGLGYPSLSPPFTFNGDFNGCQLLGGQGGWNMDESNADYPGTASVERTQVGEGPCGGKFSTPAGSSPNYVDNPLSRSEVQSSTYNASTLTATWEELFYIPSPSNNGPHYGELNQTKMNKNPDGSGGCYNGGFRLSRHDRHLKYVTVASCSATAKEWEMGPPPFDRWFAVKIAERFANAGSIQVWLDPDGPGPAGYAEKIPQTNADTMSGIAVSLKFRFGLYHRMDNHESHVWGDGFHMVCSVGC